MKCNEYIPLLSAHIDGANSEIEERRLQQHLRSCKRCRELLAQMEQTDAALVENIAEPPEDLTARIMDQVRAEPKKKRAMTRVYGSICAAALATAALLAFVFSGNLPMPGFPNDGDPVSASDNSKMQDLSEDSLASPMSAEENQSGNYYGAVSEDPSSTDSYIESAPLSDKSYSETYPVSSEPYTEPMLPYAEPTEPNVPDTEPNVTVSDPGTADTEPTVSSGLQPKDAISDETEPQESAVISLPPLSPDSTGIPVGTYPAPSNTRKPSAVTDNTPVNAPLLVIWDAAELTALEEVVPVPFQSNSAEESNFTPCQNVPADTLYDRLLSAMPLNLPPLNNSMTLPFEIKSYSVPYETMMALFEECIGTYEIAAYYPAALEDFEHCTILVVERTVEPIE